MERDLWQHLKETDKPIVLYGMGNGADKIIRVLENKGISFDGIFASDGFVRNKIVHGLPLESYEILKNRFGQMIVLLCDKAYYDSRINEFGQICSLLADETSKKTFKNIIKYKISGKIDYLFECETDFDEPYKSFLKPQGGEIILDLGAYNGDTALEFSKTFPNYEKIIAVEPDKKTFKKLVANTDGLKTENHNVCISDFTGVGSFSMNAGRNSAIGEGEEINVTTVDDLLKGEKVTLIKMDVEGEEARAITGAEKTISEYRPKMIISAYHRTEDFLEIPKNVLKIRNDYKIYMRHFPSLPAWDTVYYFI